MSSPQTVSPYLDLLQHLILLSNTLFYKEFHPMDFVFDFLSFFCRILFINFRLLYIGKWFSLKKTCWWLHIQETKLLLLLTIKYYARDRITLCPVLIIHYPVLQVCKFNHKFLRLSTLNVSNISHSQTLVPVSPPFAKVLVSKNVYYYLVPWTQ